jgi:aerobic-type carbon monoxide dehydrogenase small subunit (CoxS/CutS family)
MSQNVSLGETVDPTGEEIREELAGNLWRCGTYPQHPKAMLEAARKLHTAGEG